LVNLIPHELNMYDSEGKVILSIPPPKDTPIPRVSIRSEVVGEINILAASSARKGNVVRAKIHLNLS